MVASPPISPVHTDSIASIALEQLTFGLLQSFITDGYGNVTRY